MALCIFFLCSADGVDNSLSVCNLQLSITDCRLHCSLPGTQYIHVDDDDGVDYVDDDDDGVGDVDDDGVGGEVVDSDKLLSLR